LTQYHRSHASTLKEGYTAEDERPHHQLSDIGTADEERSKVRRVERVCDAPFWRRACSGQRSLASKLAHFAAELARTARREQLLSS
jgi:hypothetical protein